MAYRDQGRRPYEVIVFFFFFLYRFNIYMQGEKFQHRLVCKVHIPCFAEDMGLIECLTVQDGSEYYLIPIYWITE